MTRPEVFVTGATGYLGRALIPALIARGHRVKALARHASAQRVPQGALLVKGDALDPASFTGAIAPGDTLVHLVGTPHPGPGRNPAYRSVDLHSVDAALAAALVAGANHFVYVSVAQPAPIMWHYIAVRQVAESRIRGSGIPASILRPWYVLGPGHRWPCVALPFYALFERLPPTQAAARRLGFVSLSQMVSAMVMSIETAPPDVRIIDVPAIRAAPRI